MFKQLKQELAQYNAQLIAVSKTKPNAAIDELYEKGQRAFGENKVQELVEKYEALPKDIEWHLIGHLQRNKVKYIAPFVAMIHSIDSLKLLKEVQKQAAKSDRVIPVLLQMHIAEEETKFGLDKNELIEILDFYTSENGPFSNIKICGLMGMATFTDDKKQVANEFASLKDLFTFCKESYLLRDDFKEISMGMSGDYKIALEQGSTMVRIGSMLFGSRN